MTSQQTAKERPYEKALWGTDVSSKHFHRGNERPGEADQRVAD